SVTAREIERCVYKPDVTERLREIPQLALCHRIIFLCKKPNVIAQGQDTFEDLPSFFSATSKDQVVSIPETACNERTRLTCIVSVDQPIEEQSPLDRSQCS